MIQLCHFQWSCSLKLAEVNLKHGSEIPIEVCTAIFASGGNNAWWLVVGYMVLTWSKMRSPHSDDSNPISKWFGGDHKKPTSDKPNINQAVWTGISFSGAARWRALLIESGGCQPPSGCPWDWCLDAWLGGQRFVNFATDASHDPCEWCVTASITCQGTQPLMWRQHRWFPALSLIAASFQSAARTKGMEFGWGKEGQEREDTLSLYDNKQLRSKRCGNPCMISIKIWVDQRTTKIILNMQKLVLSSRHPVHLLHWPMVWYEVLGNELLLDGCYLYLGQDFDVAAFVPEKKRKVNGQWCWNMLKNQFA